MISGLLDEGVCFLIFYILICVLREWPPSPLSPSPAINWKMGEHGSRLTNEGDQWVHVAVR